MRHSASLATSLPIMLALFGAPDAKATPSARDSVAGNLVGNCGFETTGSWGQTLDNELGPHTGTYGGSVFWYDSNVYTQTITGLTVGETYNFAAWILDGYSYATTVYATIDTTNLFSATASDSWAEQTGSFVATATSMLLTIGISDQASGYGAVDDVSIVAASTPVPEPASAALLGLGLAGLAGLRRRR